MNLKILTILLFFAFNFSFYSQINFAKEVKITPCSCKDKNTVREYFEQLKAQQEFISNCEQKNEERRILLNLPIPKVISHQNSLAVSLVKPYYSKTAKRLRIFGVVIVEVFTNEKGEVVYSKVLKGNGFLRESVRKAVCLSKFRTVLYCNKPIKGRYVIKYNFIPN